MRERENHHIVVASSAIMMRPNNLSTSTAEFALRISITACIHSLCASAGLPVECIALPLREDAKETTPVDLVHTLSTPTPPSPVHLHKLGNWCLDMPDSAKS